MLAQRHFPKARFSSCEATVTQSAVSTFRQNKTCNAIHRLCAPFIVCVVAALAERVAVARSAAACLMSPLPSRTAPLAAACLCRMVAALAHFSPTLAWCYCCGRSLLALLLLQCQAQRFFPWRCPGSARNVPGKRPGGAREASGRRPGGAQEASGRRPGGVRVAPGNATQK